MKNKILFLLLIALASTAILGLNLNNVKAQNMMLCPLTSEQFDKNFLKQMMAHHEYGIRMSVMALQLAQNQEIKDLASQIIADQGGEINQMNEWYAKWYGNSIADIFDNSFSTSTMGMVMDYEKNLKALASSTPFDKKYLEDMMTHHQMAIMMSNMAENYSSHGELKTLAKNIIAKQVNELDKMQILYDKLY